MSYQLNKLLREERKTRTTMTPREEAAIAKILSSALTATGVLPQPLRQLLDKLFDYSATDFTPNPGQVNPPVAGVHSDSHQKMAYRRKSYPMKKYARKPVRKAYRKTSKKTYARKSAGPSTLQTILRAMKYSH